MKDSGNSFLLMLIFFSTIVVVFSSNNGLADNHSNGLSIEDLMQMRRVTDLKISANGNYIAYTVTEPQDPLENNESPEVHLYVYSTDTRESEAYYTRGSVNNVRFRPGKQSLTFLAKPEDREVNALYEMPIDGGAPRELFQFETDIKSYSWNSDGTRLAFTAPRPKIEKESKLPFQPEIYEEGLQQRKAYVVDMGDESPSPEKLQTGGTVYIVRCAPGGKRLAVSVAPTSLVDDYYMRQEEKLRVF